MFEGNVQTESKTLKALKNLTREEQKLTEYCKKIGLFPEDIIGISSEDGHELMKSYGVKNFHHRNLTMPTIYKELNNKQRLHLEVFLDTRMTEEEMEAIDEMSFGDLQVYCQYENPTRLTQFFHEAKGESLTRAELAERAKYDLRLTYEEIRAKETLLETAKYWCKIRPEVFSNNSREALMRLLKE